MTPTPLRSRMRWAICRAAQVSLIALVGTTSSAVAAEKRFVFVNSFQSQAPAADAQFHEASIATPPALSHQNRSLPSLTDATIDTIRLRDAESRLRKAEQHFEAGKKALNNSQPEAARRLFNQAIDLLLEAPSDVAAARDRVDRRAQELIDAIYRFDITRLGAAESPDQFVFESSPRERVLEELTFPGDPRLRSKVSDQVVSTQSQLPLEVNDAVLTYIKFFTDRGRQTLLAGLRRSGRYRGMIQRILNEEGVPQELINLAQVESGFQTRIVSWAACAGMWQFLGARGREYGLVQDGFVDERLDPEKSTRAGARHLRDLYKQFGDWYLALAAYNCGPGCVDSAVRRTGYADFWKLREMNALPRETANYVPAIVALTIISKNAKDYGVENPVMDPPIEHDTFNVADATNLELVAVAAERSLEEIRDLNPSLVRALAPKGYALHLPKGSLRSVAAALETIPAANRATWRFHRVRAGDTPALVAARYFVTPASLTVANDGLEAAEPGDLLAVPPAAYAPRVNRWVAPRWTPPAKRAAATWYRGKSYPAAAAKAAPAKKAPVATWTKPASRAAVAAKKPAVVAGKSGKSVAQQARRPGTRPGA